MRGARTVACLALLAARAAAQTDGGDTWQLASTVLYSDPPGSEDRLIPILYADRGPLHVELRYGYEDRNTASLFVGRAFELGDELAATVVPMIGGVVGDTDGIAPGLELDVAWRRVSWYAESEYLFDLHDRDDDFFYSWSTLTYGFTDWLDAGIVLERSKLVDTDWSLQRGLALELARGSFGLSLYAFNPGSDDSYAVVGLEFAP
jgi:hypothetical protein